MQTEPPTEQTLIRELKRGSQKAFNQIYGMYAKRIFAYCLQYAKLTEDAEEIVQDVFVRLWTNRENIRQEDSLRALLFIMARHRLINVYRAMLNSPVYEYYVDCHDKPAADDAGRRMEYEDFARQVRKALGQLPPTQRRVVELSRLRGLSNAEVAEKLSLSHQTVRNQLSLGLKALRAILDKTLLLPWLLLSVNYLYHAVH
ncbi:MAG: RNA polymerase sigma-70 factor [Tannerella sp.]|jgi:RNA polymerase sigma-70 factor (ECF subfamily)|nr:RNA polymerase sigma-70 factor [Tannerella sp.]